MKIMFLLVFLVGVALTALTAKNLSDDGLVPQEGAVLLIMSILTALALLLLTVIRVTEIRYGVDDPEADPDNDDRYQPEARMPVPVAPAGGAVLREQAEPVHKLDRRWGVRPDQELPPGDDPDWAASKIDPEGKAADHG